MNSENSKTSNPHKLEMSEFLTEVQLFETRLLPKNYRLIA